MPYFERPGFLPTYAPTFEEFIDFESFMTTIEPDIVSYGGCKIVTPAKWRELVAMVSPFP